ncbi:MAG TPA: pseudaminic acid synthase [Candidatus Peribacter riflensis]|uniref:Pseudaminic acid synthase n=1 Tax=Candidatus Peribacter riflensis TaxID=1735162 RepID=A0A0S1SNR3_9BACT|nr:MAG: pseudaminic acid synthase [Candidatus Peribacter riflensis]OGJ78484.1 MAG: pseudaminic acid synthase [Candidatus Peribacteria bacterium RIFOXYB1_FULL_57_12]ALM11427.1 MAG: pseudaminic acid synthase [Candidatus Peribacter riflensis]ALM12529.1 MAG: N-acetylneuraminate synthase [Candidatus Peribacter riflensis]ALM13630.1 MAG: pseudaminic acid synthase [Candidatus Peribacter riflensis]
MKDAVIINGTSIGPGHPVYIVAELSANHGQDFDRACETIRAMKDAGADAVKLQTYTPDTMTIDCDRPEFRVGKGSLWEGRTLYELYGEAFTPWEWQPKLKELAEELGMDCFSTPFDATAVDFLERTGMPAYKIASFEVVDLPLIERTARTGKPLIISTGMATEQEIREAVDCARRSGNGHIVLLKCTSAYPAAPDEMNLRTIPDMAQRFNVPVGLSDHSLSPTVPATAVALGACLIEKHFCLSRKEKGPDTAFSLEPQEFRTMVDAVRMTERALGSVSYTPGAKEKTSLTFRRSLFVVEDIAGGETFTERNIRSIRPSHGLPPKEITQVIGRRAKKALKKGTPLSWEDVG